MAADPTSFLPLPPAQFHVLAALAPGERHGYAIMQAVEEASAGRVQMGPATVYGTLQRLTTAGLVEECGGPAADDGDKRRRYYRLTGLGASVSAAEADRLAALVRTVRANLRPGLA